MFTSGDYGECGEQNGVQREVKQEPFPEVDLNVRVPHWTVAEFSRRYRLSDDIPILLGREGCVTVKGLLEFSQEDLEEIRLKVGEIAELKRALKEFLFVSNTTSSP